jgi:NhaP-type Na+/H+ and K+/H+ antiporter
MVKIVSIPILLLYIIVGIRYGIDTMGLMVFLVNPVLALIVQDNTPVIDYIKALL